MTATYNTARLAGYLWTGEPFAALELCPGWIAIGEERERESDALAVPRAQAVTTGVVLAAHPGAVARPGERIIYERWQGGRWSFIGDDGGEVRCLIMPESVLLARLED